MDPETKWQVTDALDRAIAEVASEELTRLYKIHGRQETAGQIVDALRSLKRLVEGGKPKYDEWDAIFYVLWYQPGQINLAYTLARAMLEETRGGESTLRLAGDERLHVDDFGCGAWAMQFGLALAIADLSSSSQELPAVTVNPEDESLPMQRLGKLIWKKFQSFSQGNMRYVTHTIKNQEYHSTEDIYEHWFSALHVMYSDCHYSTKKEIQSAVKMRSPDYAFMTTHGDKSSLIDFLITGYLIDPPGYITTAENSPYKKYAKYSVMNPTILSIDRESPRFERISRVRLQTLRFLNESNANIDIEFCKRYLKSSPSWVSSAVTRCAYRSYRRNPVM